MCLILKVCRLNRKEDSCCVPHTQGVQTEQEGQIVLCASHSRCEDYADNRKEEWCCVPHTQGMQTEETAGMAVSLSLWVGRPGKQWVDRTEQCASDVRDSLSAIGPSSSWLCGQVRP